MSKRDYIAIAEIVRKTFKQKDLSQNTCHDLLVLRLSKYFEEENDRFDITEFYRACGALPEEE